MGGKTTQISGFYLYAQTMRYRRGRTAIPFHEYVLIADVEYKKLTEDEKELWKQRARDLRTQDCGRNFRLINKWFQWQARSEMYEAREYAVKKLVMKCWDLALGNRE